VLIIAPLAFGTMETWSLGLMEGGIFLASLLFFIKLFQHPYRSIYMGPGLLPLSLFLSYLLLQIIPLPTPFLKIISPAAYTLRETAGGLSGPNDWLTISLTPKGTLVELRAERAVVEAGALRLEIPLTDLEIIEGGAPNAPPAPKGSWTAPGDGQVQLEVDLRGLHVDEMDLELSRALDQAVFEDLHELRIIHGKGTGALRQRVGEVLKLDARVQAFRMGGPTEGGAGVTVATFRGASS